MATNLNGDEVVLVAVASSGSGTVATSTAMPLSRFDLSGALVRDVVRTAVVPSSTTVPTGTYAASALDGSAALTGLPSTFPPVPHPETEWFATSGFTLRHFPVLNGTRPALCNVQAQYTYTITRSAGGLYATVTDTIVSTISGNTFSLSSQTTSATDSGGGSIALAYQATVFTPGFSIGANSTSIALSYISKGINLPIPDGATISAVFSLAITNAAGGAPVALSDTATNTTEFYIATPVAGGLTAGGSYTSDTLSFAEWRFRPTQGQPIDFYYKDVPVSETAKNSALWESASGGVAQSGETPIVYLRRLPSQNTQAHGTVWHTVFIVGRDGRGATGAMMALLSPAVRAMPFLAHPIGSRFMAPRSTTSDSTGVIGYDTKIKRTYTTNAQAAMLSSFISTTPISCTRNPETGDLWLGLRDNNFIWQVYRSIDDGQTWSNSGMAAPFNTTYKAQCGPVALHGGYLGAIATKGGGAHFSRSVDNGASWQIIAPPIGALPEGTGALSLLQPFVQDGDTSLLVSDGGTPGAEWQSDDIGDTWTVIT